MGVLAAAEEVVKPVPAPAAVDWTASSIMQGYAGVYSSASCCTPSGRRSATAYPAHEILQRVGGAGYVGGQEDMIIDVALQLVRERESAGAAV